MWVVENVSKVMSETGMLQRTPQNSTGPVGIQCVLNPQTKHSLLMACCRFKEFRVFPFKFIGTFFHLLTQLYKYYT